MNGLKDMRSKFRVTHNSSIKPAFMIHTNRGVIKFPETSEGVYAINMDCTKNNKNKTNVSMVTTIKENEKVYSKAKMGRERAMNLPYLLGMLTPNDLKNMIRMNLIKNNPVTIKDVDIVFGIYRSQTPSLKSKTVKKKQGITINNKIQLPHELISTNKNTVLAIDTITVNRCHFVVTISLDIFIAARTIYEQNLKIIIS